MVECGTEALLLLVSTLMQQYIIGGTIEESTGLERMVFTVLCLMFAINMAYFLYKVITNCIRNRKLKQARIKY